MYGTRRSAGKRIRMDENQDYEQQGYGGYQEEQDSSMDQSNESYDPLAFYRQQQAAMMMESTQHVQASQQEIQKAQHLQMSLRNKLYPSRMRCGKKNFLRQKKKRMRQKQKPKKSQKNQKTRH